MKYKLIIDKNAPEEVTVVARGPSPLTQQIEDLVRSSEGPQHLVGTRDEETRKLPFGEIECITVEERRVIAIDGMGGRYRLQERLRDLEAVLPSYFIRINKSTLANEHRILRFAAAFGGGVDAVFCCGHRDYVSRRCLADIRRRYEGR